MKRYNNVSSYFDSPGIATRTCLLKSGTHGLSRIKDNTIHLSQNIISDCGDVKNLLYNDVQYGKNIKLFRKRIVSNGKQICWNEINLPQMKFGYCILKTDIKEVAGDDGVININSSICDESPSGVLVLVVVFQKTQNCNECRKWGKEYYAALRYAKYNTATGTTKHFESAGYVCSYGNKGNYGMIDNSSVAQYVHKNISIKGELKAKRIDIMCSKEITMGIDNVCTIIPTMRGLIVPILDV